MSGNAESGRSFGLLRLDDLAKRDSVHGMGCVMMNRSERERLLSLLFEGDTKLVNLRCFRGDDASVTDEEICGQIRSAVQQKQTGAAVGSARFFDDVPKVDVRAWLADLQA